MNSQGEQKITSRRHLVVARGAKLQYNFAPFVFMRCHSV
uniref:Uncharacterized protein n=1 Tax=Erwinia amylovora ATCC BAA-2158 TaxID=889211 RepID=E5B0P8_ERWAM|nr:hypothetical protein predicted by Glimmer/Critica [Erwinia amylovora ATCC BAA-2158]